MHIECGDERIIMRNFRSLFFAFGLLIGGILSFIVTTAYQDKWFKKKTGEVEKFKKLFDFAMEWIAIKQDGHSISERILDQGYKCVAIYGMNILGRLLLAELKQQGVKVLYGIDRNADLIYSDCRIYKPNDKLNDVDIIIVTAISDYYEIEKDLKNKINAKVICVKDLV